MYFHTDSKNKKSVNKDRKNKDKAMSTNNESRQKLNRLKEESRIDKVDQVNVPGLLPEVRETKMMQKRWIKNTLSKTNRKRTLFPYPVYKYEQC